MTDVAVRLDRWLWAARLFRSRVLASEAAAGGKVRVNGRSAKPSTRVEVGDRMRVRRGPYEVHLVVRGLAERRGPAAAAAALYKETAESRQAREEHARRLRAPTVPVYEGKGRPTKKERREMDRLRRRPDER